MGVSVNKLEDVRLKYGENNGSSIVNQFYGIAFDYPQGWKIKFLDKAPLKIRFSKNIGSELPFFELNVYRTLVPNSTQELQQVANQFLSKKKISVLQSYWERLGTIYYQARSDPETSASGIYDPKKATANSLRMPLPGIEAYVIEYVENALQVIHIFFFQPNEFVASLIYGCSNSKKDPIRSINAIPDLNQVVGSMHFVPSDKEGKGIESVYYYFAKGEAYLCSVCGTSGLKNPCPTCSSIRSKIWCQECSFLNPVELFIQNHHYCAMCGEKVDAKLARTSDCFVATAIFENEHCIEVEHLKTLRDRYFINNALGAIFVHYYYRYGPLVAEAVEKKPQLRKLLRPLFKFFCRATLMGQPHILEDQMRVSKT